MSTFTTTAEVEYAAAVVDGNLDELMEAIADVHDWEDILMEIPDEQVMRAADRIHEEMPIDPPRRALVDGWGEPRFK